MNDVGRIMQLAPVIPVLVIEDIAYARPIAEALVAGGLRALEVTLRTPVALDAIREMAKVDGAIAGAGTVLNEADLEASLEAGARFIVSPGLTEPLSKAAIASGIPFLPGIATAGDVMRGLDLGLSRFKFFPAVAAGGIRERGPDRPLQRVLVPDFGGEFRVLVRDRVVGGRRHGLRPRPQR